MTLTSLLVKNIAELCSLSSIMNGGKMNSTINGQRGKNTLIIILILLIILLIKGFIVYMLYNYMMPKLLYSLSALISLFFCEWILIEAKHKNDRIILLLFFTIIFFLENFRIFAFMISIFLEESWRNNSILTIEKFKS